MSVASGRQAGESLQDFIARRKAERDEDAGGAGPATFDPDLIPDAGRGPGNEDDDAITRLLKDQTSIIDGYRQWCRKMEPNVGGKRESIMVSCPNPQHPDNVPSAWVNLDKNTGNCPLCGGFDNYDIFAWNSGSFSKEGFRTDGTFPAMRRAMAKDLGHVVGRTPMGTVYVQPIVYETPEPPTPADTPENEPEPALAPVIRISGDPEPVSAYDACPPILWRDLLDDESTFLAGWMQTCSLDDLPEEFYFWLGLMALGCAVGNNVKLQDRWPVRANLLLCLVAPTGMGKSRSTRALYDLMREAFPFYVAQPGGVKMIPMPGSAESLIDQFNVPIYDPVDMKTITGHNPVRGIVKIDELASLTGRAARQGNVIKPTLMEFYDSEAKISITSRSSGLAEADGHFAQVVATTQPRAMRDMLSQADNNSGFLNRWIFATGIAKKLTSIGGELIDVTPHVDPIRAIRAWASKVRNLPMDDDAFPIWDEFFHENLVPLKMSEDSAVFVRLDLLLKKLMLLFAIDKQQESITKDTVRQVLFLWDYLKATYGHVDEAVSGSDSNDMEVRLMDAIANETRTLGRGATAREIRRRIGERVWRKMDSGDIVKHLKVLVDLGLIKTTEVSTSGRGGRPSTRYEMSDDVVNYSP